MKIFETLKKFIVWYIEDLSKNETRGFDKSTSFFFLSLSPFLVATAVWVKIPNQCVIVEGDRKGRGEENNRTIIAKVKS